MSSPPKSLPDSCPSSSSSKLSQDQAIRSKLLNRLGIYGDAPAQQPMTAAQARRVRILRGMGMGGTMGISPPDGSAVRPPLNGVTPYPEPLKTDVSKKKSALPQPKKETRIAFQDEVEVVPIPTRYEYSDRIKSRIWSNRHELQENAERNAMEFAAEGWNWRNVTEDEGMFICSVSGELVHPIHLQHLVTEEQSSPSQTGPSNGGGLERGTPVHSN